MNGLDASNKAVVLFDSRVTLNPGRVIVVEASYRTIEAALKAEIDRLRH